MRRILSIDGGGIKGVFPAAFLANLEAQIDAPIGDYFDLVVGTSTGGIIALALGLGLTAGEILQFYRDLGPAVFEGGRFIRALRHFGVSKYSSEPLRDALVAKFGAKRLGESRTRLVIPSLNLATGEVHLYKTAHHPRLSTDYKASVVDVALATSAAPTYFPTHLSAAGLPLIDGGMWANNPVGLAVVEAISMLGWTSGEFSVLSIGCTTHPLDVSSSSLLGSGLVHWLSKALDVMMAAQASASLGTALHLAGHQKVIRIDPVMPKGRFALDVTKQLDQLAGLGYSEARKAAPLLSEYWSSKAAKFTPFHLL